jgi:ketosteroid isomerase-like protein
MSANLDLVRSILAAWERGDYSSIEWAHPEIALVSTEGPNPGIWTGLAGLAEGTRDWLTAWKEFRFIVDEHRELHDERVLVLVRYSGRAKTSKVDLAEIGTKGAWLFHMRDGKVTKIVRYADRERAFADLGLKE